MPLKRPVTLPQARRWPAAAARRESFCARMGGMRDKLTGEDAATDPDSPINRALAAWDCDEPELLQRRHVSKGIRPMKITQSKVGSEARKPARKTARKNPSELGTYGPFYHDPGERLTESQIERKAEAYMDRLDRMLMRGDITQPQYERENKALNKWAKEQYANRKRNPARKTAAKNPASVMVHGYAVIWNDAQSGKWQTVALTLKKPDAVEIAQLLADKNKERYAVQPRFIHEKDLEVY